MKSSPNVTHTILDQLGIHPPSAQSQWQKRWESWQKTLEMLEMPLACSDSSDPSSCRINQPAKNDLQTSDDFVPREILAILPRTFLISDPEIFVWFPTQGRQNSLPPSLTPREQQVLQAMVDGMTLKETSMLLGISQRTVEKHRENIRNKMKA